MTRDFRFGVSIALNIVLVAVVLVLIRHRAYRGDAAASPIADQSNAITHGTAVHVNQSGTGTSHRYAEISSATDRRRFVVDQLRAAGVPNAILARFALADIEEYWQRHAEEVATSTRGDPEIMSKLQLEQDRQRDAEMRAALGDEAFKQWDQRNMLREAISGKIQLTAAENDAVYDLKKALQARQRELDEARLAGKLDDATINTAMEKALSELNLQMKALLGEERYAQSQGLDPATAAENLQRDLAKVNPSEAQLQALLKAQQQWNDRRAELDAKFKDDPSSSAYVDEIKALDVARDQEYERVLGTATFDALQKDQDLRYTKMKKYGETWGLDEGNIDYVYRAVRYYDKVVEEYESQSRALEAQGQHIDWAAVKKNVQQFGQQTEQALQKYLGPDRMGKLQQNSVIQFNQPEIHHGGPS